MASSPRLDILTKDPLISTDLSTFSPLSQIVAGPFVGTQPVAAYPTSMEAEHVIAVDHSSGELDPLLGAIPKKPFYRARPLWYVDELARVSISRHSALCLVSPGSFHSQ